MNKVKLQELVDAYNVRGKNTHLGTDYHKGFRKRLFGLRTDGIMQLEKFLNSDKIKSLHNNDPITGGNLKELITLLEERDDRIRHKRRGFEAYPDKSTNKVYQKIYELLCFDVITEESLRNGIFTPDDLGAIKTALVTRESHKRQYEYEQKAKKGDVGAAKILGIGLTSDKTIEFSDYEFELLHANIPQEFQKVSCEMNAPNGKISAVIEVIELLTQTDIVSVVIIPAVLKFSSDFKTGIKWLEYASDKGSKSASYHLAKLYADDKMLNQDKAIHYLKLAADFGSTKALDLLRDGGEFNQITIATNSHEPKKSPALQK